MSWSIPQTHFLSLCGALWELRFWDKGGKHCFLWRWHHLWLCELSVLSVPFAIDCFWWLVWIQDGVLSSCVPKHLHSFAYVFQLSLKEVSLTLWITALFKSLTPRSAFYCCLTFWESVWVWVFSASRAVIGGRGLTGVSLSWAQRAQQIDSPCLLPFSTDRLRAWAPSQHYQSIRSYPQPLTLIGGQLPKGQGSMNHSPTTWSFYASKYMCCGSKSPLCFAINGTLASDCHNPVTSCSIQEGLKVWGRRIVGLGLVFLSDQKPMHLCPSPTQT